MNIYGKRYLDRCPSIYFCGYAYLVENINDSEWEDEKRVVFIHLNNLLMIDSQNHVVQMKVGKQFNAITWKALPHMQQKI